MGILFRDVERLFAFVNVRLNHDASNAYTTNTAKRPNFSLQHSYKRLNLLQTHFFHACTEVAHEISQEVDWEKIHVSPFKYSLRCLRYEREKGKQAFSEIRNTKTSIVVTEFSLGHTWKGLYTQIIPTEHDVGNAMQNKTRPDDTQIAALPLEHPALLQKHTFARSM